MINTVYVIAGPTAIGKSDLSISLGNKINGAIINSDSMQVYKNLEILTARPSSIEMKNIDHYLYGFVNGSDRYNVERWCNDATEIIKKISVNNLTPILVGGTGLYINTLINGLIDSGMEGKSTNPFISVFIYKPVPPTNIGVKLLELVFFITSEASLHHFSTLYLSLPSTKPYKWWSIFFISLDEGRAVSISRFLYTCMLSELITAPLILFPREIANSDFPVAVGPAIT